MAKKTFYLTTPIYYPSDRLHIGHSYSTVAADTMCRFKRLSGYDVHFLTGTDEHGQKIERIAAEKGVTPQAYVDHIVEGILKLWELMNISYDDFIRTTEPRHKKGVEKVFMQLYEKGDIYKGSYEGWYCTPCESFWTQLQLEDGCCPDCGRPVEKVREEAYFLKLSKYQDWLIDYIETHPDFICPASRAKEMISSFLKPGLEDLCVSRSSFTWGIPVPIDTDHVIYVWLDALSNYITALGYGQEDTSLFDRYWPADVHLVGKEIVRFHTIIWPIVLHALGLELPKKVFAHGWWSLDGGKMSKSKGNVVDPEILCGRYGVDAIRYFLLREIPFGADGNFSNEALLARINTDLANDLGNLVSRTVAMIEKYFDGNIPDKLELTDVDIALRDQALALPTKVDAALDDLQFSAALSDIWAFVGACNKYIDVTTPWILAKEEKTERLGTVLYNLAESIRFISVLITPFMPSTPECIWQQLGLITGPKTDWDSLTVFGAIEAGTKVQKGDALFPRIDIEAELAFLDGLIGKGSGDKKIENKPEKAEPKAETKKEDEAPAQISIDDFFQSRLQVARVITCEKVEKSEKLLKFLLDLGDHQRTVVSGIAKYYDPADLVGRNVIVVTNLKPAKLCGIVSEGMILSAEDAEGNLQLLTVDGDSAPGSIVG